jgi:hypothetical protein
MSGAVSLVSPELEIVLQTVARELGCERGEVPLEIEAVTKAALLACYNKGINSGSRSERERHTTLPPPPPLPREARGGEGDAGVYLFVERAATTRPPPRKR